MIWFTKVNFGKIFNIFGREKKYLKLIIPKYLYKPHNSVVSLNMQWLCCVNMQHYIVW